MVQMVKHLPAMRETRVWSLGCEDLLEKGVATHSSILAWRIPRTEEPGRLQSMGSQRVGHYWVTSLHSLTWPWSKKWRSTEANRLLSREHIGHNKHLFQQNEIQSYTRIPPNSQYRNQTDYILCSQRWRSSVQSAKSRPGADCGSDLKLKKVGKTSRPFRYNLNQIPYDYTWKWWIKGLALVTRVH